MPGEPLTTQGWGSAVGIRWLLRTLLENLLQARLGEAETIVFEGTRSASLTGQQQAFCHFTQDEIEHPCRHRQKGPPMAGFAKKFGELDVLNWVGSRGDDRPFHCGGIQRMQDDAYQIVQ